MKRVLIVDDDVAVTNYFMVFLMQTELFEPTVVNDSREVEQLLEKDRFDAIMLDLDMPNVSGMDILDMMAAKGFRTPVLILTGVNDVELAVKSMKRGAFDYLTKPVDDEQLLEVLNAAMEHGILSDSLESMSDQLTRKDLTFEAAFEHFPTRNPDMIRLFHQAERMAAGDLSVFIWGERGTGKEAIARAIHNASPRVEGPFIAVDSASHSPEDLSAELFGRVQDWTGRDAGKPGFLGAAEGGTLFIDNVECMSLPVQVRLKRFIQTGEYYRDNSTEILSADVRIIVSSTRDLTRSKYRDSFSRDFLYHLMVNSIKIPPLRERVDDIPVLAAHFLAEESARLGRELDGISSELMELLEGYGFPDNVQELRNIVASAAVNTESGLITQDALSPYIRENLIPGDSEGEFVPMTLREAMADHVIRTLEYCGDQKDQAAKLLDLPESRIDELIRSVRPEN